MPIQANVLVVDDSALSRSALKVALESHGSLKVVGEAGTGEEALELSRKLRPNLVTMDLNMPGMGGLRAIEIMMRESPLPIVVISERSSSKELDLNYEALSRGAMELVPKSDVFGTSALHLQSFVNRMYSLATERSSRLAVSAPALLPLPEGYRDAPLILGIGASTGGPKAVARLLADLPPDFPLPIALVQHMADDFFESFIRFLADASKRHVVAAQSGMFFEPGVTVVAPPRQEMFVHETLSVRLTPSPRDASIGPTVDSLFFSMATSMGSRAIGVLLTGMGEDGAQGLLRMRRRGAQTVVQDQASCAVFGMPRAALDIGAAAGALPLSLIAPWLVEAAKAPSLKRKTKKSVLIVDDPGEAANNARTVLKNASYDVEILDNPMILARTLRKKEFDLILLESELTATPGNVVMHSLRTHGFAKIPVLLFSKGTVAQLRDRATACGAQAFVAKGDTAELLAQVSALVGKSVRSSDSRPPKA